MPLTEDEISKIRQESEALYPYMPVEQGDYGTEQRYIKNRSLVNKYRKGYVHGVTAERERAKGMVTLDIYLTNGRVAKLLYPADITTVDGLLIQSRITDLLTNK